MGLIGYSYFLLVCFSPPPHPPQFSRLEYQVYCTQTGKISVRRQLVTYKVVGNKQCWFNLKTYLSESQFLYNLFVRKYRGRKLYLYMDKLTDQHSEEVNAVVLILNPMCSMAMKEDSYT